VWGWRFGLLEAIIICGSKHTQDLTQFMIALTINLQVVPVDLHFSDASQTLKLHTQGLNLQRATKMTQVKYNGI